MERGRARGESQKPFPLVMPGFLPGIHAFFPDNAKSAVVHGGDHRHRRLSGLEAATASGDATRRDGAHRARRSCCASPTLGDARVSFAGSGRIALVKKLNSAKRRAATSAVSVRGGCAAGSISDFAEPVELLSCAGSCTCTCAGSCTCAPHLTPLCPSCAPHLTPLVPC